MESKVLLVESEEVLQDALAFALEAKGFVVTAVSNVEDALEEVRTNNHDIVVSNVESHNVEKDNSRLTGLDLLNQINQHHDKLPVILMTAQACVENGIQAIRSGAVDYIVKSFEENRLVETVVSVVTDQIEQSNAFIAADDKTRKIKNLTAQVARADVSVMIRGESGVGKEVLAQYIHRCSRRSDGPFVAINCAAIPENMLEAMLFGYEKGAYTGATHSSAGKFEQAQGGTLLLDEISEMDLSLQAKLLRVIQERQVERLGGKNVINLDVRILATTNRNLKHEVSCGRFREDLYYRLNVFPIQLPALRERPGDIIPIAAALLAKYSSQSVAKRFSSQAEECLLAHQWPGNIRELDNVIQRACVLASGTEITADDISIDYDLNLNHEEDQSIQNVSNTPEVDLKTQEQELILHTLKAGNGSRKYAAEKLGISPRTLRYKLARLKEKGIEVPSVMRLA